MVFSRRGGPFSTSVYVLRTVTLGGGGWPVFIVVGVLICMLAFSKYVTLVSLTAGECVAYLENKHMLCSYQEQLESIK